MTQGYCTNRLLPLYIDAIHTLRAREDIPSDWFLIEDVSRRGDRCKRSKVHSGIFRLVNEFRQTLPKMVNWTPFRGPTICSSSWPDAESRWPCRPYPAQTLYNGRACPYHSGARIPYHVVSKYKYVTKVKKRGWTVEGVGHERTS